MFKDLGEFQEVSRVGSAGGGGNRDAFVELLARKQRLHMRVSLKGSPQFVVGRVMPHSTERLTGTSWLWLKIPVITNMEPWQVDLDTWTKTCVTPPG